MVNFLHSKLKDFKGFTLLEMIISIGIFVLVATATSVVFNQALRAYSYTTSRMAAVREAELAMEWIVRDIRPDETGTVLAITATSDNDEITLGTGNQIHYHRHNDNTTQREELPAGTHSLLAQGVVQLNFTYYNQTNIVETSPENNPAVRTVEITIITRNNQQEFLLYNVANR
jgi:prepilin-type N-terminal cleavage/methylation domain-containing protein